MEQDRHANHECREAVVTHAHLFVTACVCVCVHARAHMCAKLSSRVFYPD